MTKVNNMGQLIINGINENIPILNLINLSISFL
jgi:hypothetical protein